MSAKMGRDEAVRRRQERRALWRRSCRIFSASARGAGVERGATRDHAALQPAPYARSL